MYSINRSVPRHTRHLFVLTFVATLLLIPAFSLAQSLDQYGGYLDLSAPGGATGFFRVAKIGSQWTLVTPEGHALWSLGVALVNNSNPGTDPAGITYNTSVYAKYGNAYPTWASQIKKRLLAWGFNTLGVYDSSFVRSYGSFGRTPVNPLMPHFASHGSNFAGSSMRNSYSLLASPVKNIMSGGLAGRGGNIPDVFDPAFTTYANTFMVTDVMQTTGGLQAEYTSPWVLGYATDELDVLTGFGPKHTHIHLGWAALAMAPTQSVGYMLGVQYTYSDPTVYTKLALRDFLKTRYGNSLAALNAAWGSAYTSWDSAGGYGIGTGLLDENGTHAWVGPTDPLMRYGRAAPAVKADLDDFLSQIARQYFMVVHDAIRSVDPNRLIFGPISVAADTRPQVLLAAKDYVDAFIGASHRLADVGTPQQGSPVADIYDLTGKPVLAASYFFTAEADSPLAILGTPPGGYGFSVSSTQGGRGQAYATNLDQLVKLQGADGTYPILGFHWWALADNWTERRNYGLVTVRDNAYDGKEAVVAPGADPWGYLTGGEVANYGDFLSTVIQAHTNILPVLLGSQPVSVAITAPPNASLVTGTVSVTATASDNVGVTRVDLLLDGTLAATFSGATAGYSWNTTTTSNGSHTWVAKAYHAAGNTGLSAPVGVTVSNADTTPPTVSITSPVNGALVKSNSTITIAATASDNVGATKVEFYVNGSRKCSVANSPYACAWKVPRASGRTYQLQAKAYDAAGNVGSSSTVTVTPF